MLEIEQGSVGNKVKLYQKDNGLIYFNDGNGEVEVQVKQCFPWKHPQEYISLRNQDDKEVYLINNLLDLPTPYQKLIAKQLQQSMFVLDVVKIFSIEEDVELRRFHCLTEQGERTFQTKLEDWPEVINNNEILIEDLAGDLFRIHNWMMLDKKSRSFLSPYVS